MPDGSAAIPSREGKGREKKGGNRIFAVSLRAFQRTLASFKKGKERFESPRPADVEEGKEPAAIYDSQGKDPISPEERKRKAMTPWKCLRAAWRGAVSASA